MKNFNMDDLIPIVADLVDKYTSKESSSIPYDKAKQLMNAVIYCIQEQEREEKNPTELSRVIVSTDKKLSARQAYESGYNLVLKKVQKAKLLYEEIIVDFNDYGNRAYYDTIIKGMPEFFRYYDAKFFPQNHILTLDYPTLVGVDDCCGIDAVERYLTYIHLEQMFLRAFPERNLLEILNAVNGGYEELFVNISGVILRHILGCMIAGKRIIDIYYSKEEFELIKEFIKSRSRDELEEQLSEFLQLIIQKGYENNQLLFIYLSADIRILALNSPMQQNMTHYMQYLASNYEKPCRKYK